MDLNTTERNITARSVLTPGLVDFQKFIFGDRYHVTTSALAQVFSHNDRSHAMDNLFQSLQNVSCVVAV